MALFSTAFWAPVSYYHFATRCKMVEFEQYERYQKQSYRNRCTILSSNGPLSLVVPVLRPHDCLIRDARIDYSKPWQREHWRTIESAYRSSAFFEEFCEEIYEVYNNEIPFLFDLNIKVWEITLALLRLSVPWKVTEQFTMPAETEFDYRFRIHPKVKRSVSEPFLNPYFQIFSPKFGFVPDLSILDALFNEGHF